MNKSKLPHEYFVGQKFGVWNVISFSHEKGFRKYYDCVCQCGKKRKLDNYSLLSKMVEKCKCQIIYSEEYINEKLKDKKINRLTVISFSHRDKNNYVYLNCICECGKTNVVSAGNLLTNNVKSCGCLQEEARKTSNLKHGKRKSKVYKAYFHIKERCLNTNCKAYPYYGGRGITIYADWLGENGFQNFYDYIGDPPSSKHSIDRINNDGNYEPGNVRWATPTEQGRNKRSTKASFEIAQSIREDYKKLKEINTPKIRIYLRDKYNLPITCIEHILNNKVWKPDPDTHG